ncbi:putative hydroxyethylthiazole kinase [Rhypophila decipiens]|uniref:Hydroxyethylthiazole kinase n=1 Tax=Rhypophila decipiens TaxID=261697 RepID=A0AAN6YGB9_9PEZI|nr:putative hydroxyethylthiazole kinase [Rhypophila decipiens]
MEKKKVDYSVYLVTDSRPEVLGQRDFYTVVEAALKGGVTCVQLREKTGDTGALIQTARRLHEITQRYQVPLLINDRVDVALAVNCEGVHIGQDDMSLPEARRLLGPDKIIGVSASTPDEAREAVKGGADYLGIGTVYSTQTKSNTKHILGPEGVRDILEAISSFPKVRTVCIGGINEENAQEVLSKSATSKRKLDGIAVVSAVMAASNPLDAAKRLASLTTFQSSKIIGTRAMQDVVSSVPAIVKAVHEQTPLSHNMTNLVVQNFAANIALAIGASPIMSNHGDEAEDLCKHKGSLVINMGTVDDKALGNYVKALKAYNRAGVPVVFDPVGAGATSVRRNALKTLLDAGYMDVVKGNENEIKAVVGDSSTQQRGVDSSSTLTDQEKATMVENLARTKETIVVMTGVSDFVSDGTRTLQITNGHPYLASITGSGCTLGTTISAAVAVWPEDNLAAVVGAILHYEIAAEIAASRNDVRGPGTFIPAFIDELYNIRQNTSKGDLRWLQRARVMDVVLTTTKILRFANALKIPIYVTTQNRTRLGDTVAELKPHLPSSLVKADLDKTRFSMYIPPISTEHFPFLASSSSPGPGKGAEVAIVGIESHICVTQTALDLLEAGYKVYIIADGVSSCNSAEVPIALDRLRQAGAVVTTSESWMYECMGDSGIGEFKDVVKIVKDTMGDTKGVMEGLVGGYSNGGRVSKI